MKGLAELVPPSRQSETVDEHMWIKERTAPATSPCFSQGQTSREPPIGLCGPVRQRNFKEAERNQGKRSEKV